MTGVPLDPDDFELPSGTILPWHRSGDSAPVGWAFCDGNNGTPDLRDGFLKGIPDSSTDPGQTIGQNSYSLATAQLPSHDHYINISGSVGDHNHASSAGNKQNASDSSNYGDGADSDSSDGSFTFFDNGSHSHNIDVDNSGGGNSIDNRPNSQTVAFIQKL